MDAKILPWLDWEEWTSTSALLFAVDGAHRSRGVDQVKAWRARGRIPIAVDATASLMEVALLEATMPLCSAHALRIMYSMVIIRTVNGLVEGQQTKYYAEPINVLAGRLGIPQWLVDLRHEATHSQLPSLSGLRLAAQQLLDWLYQSYWQKQAADLQDSYQAAYRLLSAYKSVAFRAQEECPSSLFKSCREADAPPPPPSQQHSQQQQAPSQGVNNAIAHHFNLITEALDGIMASITPTFLSGFLLPVMVRNIYGDSFLLPDDDFPPSSSSISWLKHRQLYMPLLVRLQRTFPGMTKALLRQFRCPPSSSSFNAWIQLLHSRDWHSHFDYGREEANFAFRRGVGSIRFNLRGKPPENWTAAEIDFMGSAASPKVLQEGGVIDCWEKKEGNSEDRQEQSGWRRCEHWRATTTSCPIGYRTARR